MSLLIYPISRISSCAFRLPDQLRSPGNLYIQQTTDFNPMGNMLLLELRKAGMSSHPVIHQRKFQEVCPGTDRLHPDRKHVRKHYIYISFLGYFEGLLFSFNPVRDFRRCWQFFWWNHIYKLPIFIDHKFLKIPFHGSIHHTIFIF